MHVRRRQTARISRQHSSRHSSATPYQSLLVHSSVVVLPHYYSTIDLLLLLKMENPAMENPALANRLFARFILHVCPLLFAYIMYPTPSTSILVTTWSSLTAPIWVFAFVFNFMWNTVTCAAILMEAVLKGSFLFSRAALGSYCYVGRALLKRAPARFTEILATTLLSWLGYKLFEIHAEINQKIRTGATGSFWQIARDVMRQKLKPTGTGRCRTYRDPRDPPAPPTSTLEPLKTSINAALEELVCPITLELPVDPVITEGGDVCEREAITALIRQNGMDNLKSPRTNQPISPHLADAVAIRNVIEKLVGSGLVDDEVATAWKKGREELEERGNDSPLPFRSHIGWGNTALGRQLLELFG